MNALKSPYAKVLGAGVFVFAAIAFIYFEMHADAAGVNDANTRNYLDVATGKPFRHPLVVGERIPIHAPSGDNTGYPAELCYWTADGKPSDTATSVVLNQSMGKRGPTFCPVCHRLVVAFNQMAGPDVTVPPTEAEWKAAHPGRGEK